MNAITNRPGPANEAVATSTQPPPRRSRRRWIGIPLGLLALLLVVIAGTWWMIEGRWLESTDNAYVQGDITVLSPRIDGDIAARGEPEHGDVPLAGGERQ